MNKEFDPIAFAESQLMLAKRQSECVLKGDLAGAEEFGRQINNSLPTLVRILKQCKTGEILPEIAEQIVSISKSIREIQKEALTFLETASQKLADLIQEVQVGKKVLHHYKASPVQSQFFEIDG